MPSHILACVKAPKWFYKEIDNRRRGYFWTGQISASGGQCKVAWDVVCRSIEEGRLGIKNLETQNISPSKILSQAPHLQQLLMGQMDWIICLPGK
jgi:hypothetical protein